MARNGEDPGTVEAIAARLHGVPHLLVGNERRTLERKTAGLIAYVASRGPSSRASLAGLLWPDAVPEGARNNLRQALFKLKKAAGRDVIAGVDTLCLAEGVSCQFGDATAGDALLAGCDYADCPEFLEWLTRERELLSGRGLASLVESATCLEREGALEGALDAAQRALRIAPLEESNHRRVMRLRYLRGDRAAALAAFEECARVLREELDAEPDAQTRELAASMADEKAPRPSPQPSAVPMTLVRPPRLIGRDSELASMEAAWLSAKAFVLLGEAGSGKSRLIFEFARGREGLVCSSARPGDQSIPYASLARLLHAVLDSRPGLVTEDSRGELTRVLPELGDGHPSHHEAHPRILAAAIGALLRRAVAQDVNALILDDLHFADIASVEMLNALAGEELGLRWGFAQRPAEGVPQARMLREALGDAWRLDSVPLMPFDASQMIEFIESLRVPGISAPHLAPQLLKATGGNPLFALETLKSAILSGAAFGEGGQATLPRPATVGALIERRLAQLSSHALALARVAAIAGVDFDADVAARVLEEKTLDLADAWRELEDAHVLSDATFAHDLIYEATLRGVPAPIARHAHGVIAAFLEGKDGASERIAEHWIAAGESSRAIPFLERAAANAEKAARFAEARVLLEQAIRFADSAGAKQESFELRFHLIELLKDIGERDDILSIVEAMHEDAESPDERLRLGRAEVQARYYMNRDFDGAMRAGERLLEDEELIAQAAPRRIAELHYALGDTLLSHRKLGEALRHLEPMEPEFRTHPDPQFRGWYYSDLGRALLLTDRLPEAERHLQTALDMARRVGRNRMVSGVLLVLAQLASVAGRLQEPSERLNAAQLLIADMEDSLLSRAIHFYGAEYLINQGRYREALDAVGHADATREGLSPSWKSRIAALQELLWAQLGDAHRSRLFRAQCEAEKVDGPLRTLALANRIESLLLLGEAAQGALADYEAQLADLPPSAAWRLEFWRARSGKPTASMRELAAIADEATRAGLMGHAIEAHVAALRLAARKRDAKSSATHGRSAMELLRRHTMAGAYRPALWLACHEALAGLDSELAAIALREGTAWIRTIARYQVAHELKSSFLKTNRVNRRLLEAERAGSAAPSQ